ncbi:hypothetical protein Sjap_000703 [Stephania japonica]|uniref:Uncharacterized protein n=1 Tax=Stephania japonica TaxID=461633 RepID=A0AAP0KIL7_9MAGN
MSFGLIYIKKKENPTLFTSFSKHPPPPLIFFLPSSLSLVSHSVSPHQNLHRR